jgi:hypothetical protein
MIILFSAKASCRVYFVDRSFFNSLRDFEKEAFFRTSRLYLSPFFEDGRNFFLKFPSGRV